MALFFADLRRYRTINIYLSPKIQFSLQHVRHDSAHMDACRKKKALIIHPPTLPKLDKRKEGCSRENCAKGERETGNGTHL